MTHNEILQRYSNEENLLIADGLDEAIIGIEEKTMRVIYSVQKILHILTKDMSYEEALEYYYYNICNASMGDKTPIWCNDVI